MSEPEIETDRVIIGIDPGTTIMGYGVIQISGNSAKLLSAGVIRLEKLKDHALKLNKIFTECQQLMENFKPDELAIEAPFYGKNVQSMLKLGRAQGVAIAAAISYRIPVFEYSPKAIKQSITGNGNASKEQVAAMLQELLKFSETPRYLDATDGLAAAVCHYFRGKQNFSSPGRSSAGWSEFVQKNPDRIN